MNKVVLHKNPNGDTRSAPKDVTIEQFREANKSHVLEVRQCMNVLSQLLSVQGLKHDWTKFSFEDEFYRDFLNTMNNGADFVSGEWYQRHITEEKHHPFSKCHDDITLLDILETIVDCVCAGKARTGTIRPLEFDTEILEKAVKNTVELVNQMTVVEGESNV